MHKCIVGEPSNLRREAEVNCVKVLKTRAAGVKVFTHYRPSNKAPHPKTGYTGIRLT